MDIDQTAIPINDNAQTFDHILTAEPGTSLEPVEEF